MPDFMLVLFGVALAGAVMWSRSRYADFLAQRPEDYRGGDLFDLRTHLNGPILCDGVIFGPMGRVSSRFSARFDCSWQGDTGVMREHFFYDDGSDQIREWQLSLGADGRVEARADDVEGIGRGQQVGSALRLKYRYRLPASSGGHVMDVVDWMYLSPGGTIVNRSQFRKFGIKVAELVATMRPAAVEQHKAA